MYKASSLELNEFSIIKTEISNPSNVCIKYCCFNMPTRSSRQRQDNKLYNANQKV